MTLPRLLAVVAAACFALAAAPSANAWRSPTKSEMRQLANAWSGPTRCYLFIVSTENRRFAAVTPWMPPADRCLMEIGNGIQFLERSHGRWTVGSGMSDCPRRVDGVPRAVYRDLSYIYCRGRWRRGL